MIFYEILKFLLRVNLIILKRSKVVKINIIKYMKFYEILKFFLRVNLIKSSKNKYQIYDNL